jgi:acyl-coenzyme A synthetase/AMP-(fatty) acid ligase
MAELLEKGGVVNLWGGWSLELPSSYYQRNDDGSWSAWGADWTVDVHIIETSGDSEGRPVRSEHLLGNSDSINRISGNGWVGSSEVIREDDGQQSVYRLTGQLCSTNTWMSCWVSYMREDQRTFADHIIRSVNHH